MPRYTKAGSRTMLHKGQISAATLKGGVVLVPPPLVVAEVLLVCALVFSEAVLVVVTLVVAALVVPEVPLVCALVFSEAVLVCPPMFPLPASGCPAVPAIPVVAEPVV